MIVGLAMNLAFLFGTIGISIACAQGTVQQSMSRLGNTNERVLAFHWTRDASDGSIPRTNGQLQGCCRGYYVALVVIHPGDPNPTEGHSVALIDSTENDFLGGTTAGLSATITQSFTASISAPPIR
jgi:hypothetical protein